MVEVNKCATCRKILNCQDYKQLEVGVEVTDCVKYEPRVVEVGSITQLRSNQLVVTLYNGDNHITRSRDNAQIISILSKILHELKIRK